MFAPGRVADVSLVSGMLFELSLFRSERSWAFSLPGSEALPVAWVDVDGWFSLPGIAARVTEVRTAPRTKKDKIAAIVFMTFTCIGFANGASSPFHANVSRLSAFRL